MSVKRPIKAIHLDGTVPGVPPTGIPELTMIAPGDVVTDGRYQRELKSSASLALIRRIVAEWDWRKWRPPVCVWTEGGLEAIDGQHGLTAAASHPGIDQVPVLIVEAESLQERARTFLGINSDRLAVTKTQMHVAAVTAGDPEAVRIDALLRRVGMRVRKTPPAGGSKHEPRDTMSVSGIVSLVRKVGEEQAEAILRILAEAECAPVKAEQIRAATHLMTSAEFAGQFEPADLTAAIVALRGADEKEAKLFAGTHGVPVWRGLAAIWFKKVRKRRPPPSEAQPGPAASAVTSMRRVIDRTPPAGPVSLGDPPAGRSALDQQRARA